MEKKIIGLRKASGETKNLRGSYSSEYVELFFSTAENRVWTRYQVSLGQNSWTEYGDPSIVKIGNIASPMTMSQISEMVEREMLVRR